jgi:hypothetical protein
LRRPPEQSPSWSLRVDSDTPLGQLLAGEHQVFFKPLSAVSIVFRSSGDMLGAAFFIIWTNQLISSG